MARRWAAAVAPASAGDWSGSQRGAAGACVSGALSCSGPNVGCRSCRACRPPRATPLELRCAWWHARQPPAAAAEQLARNAPLPALARPLQAPNVRYLQSAAEFLSEHLPPRSVDLIAMAETLHWCGRVCEAPGGAWGGRRCSSGGSGGSASSSRPRRPFCFPALQRGMQQQPHAGHAGPHCLARPALPPPPAPASAAAARRVDHVAFYEECRKVLKPTGVLVIWRGRLARSFLLVVALARKSRGRSAWPMSLVRLCAQGAPASHRADGGPALRAPAHPPSIKLQRCAPSRCWHPRIAGPLPLPSPTPRPGPLPCFSSLPMPGSLTPPPPSLQVLRPK